MGVSGEFVTLEAVGKAMGLEEGDHLSQMADVLERVHRLIRIRGIERSGQNQRTVCVFRHILFQQLLHDGMQETERTRIHRRLGEALESLYGEERSGIALQLARHFRKGNAREKAVEYLSVAVMQARDRSAYAECVRHSREARSLIDQLPESASRDRLELETVCFPGFLWFGGLIEPGELDGILDRTILLSTRFGEYTLLFWALSTRFTQYHLRGEQDAGREVLEQIGNGVTRLGEPALTAQYHGWMALNTLNRGVPRKAILHADTFLATYDPSRHEVILSPWLREPLPVY